MHLEHPLTPPLGDNQTIIDRLKTGGTGVPPVKDARLRACSGWRPADTIFRRDAENHTRDGYVPRKAVVRTPIFNAFALHLRP